MGGNFEEERLAATRRYLTFDQERQNDLKQIVMLASVICKSPIALITLMDYDIQLIKARVGIDVDEMPRNTSFCNHAIQQEQIMVVNDATKDERFLNAPVVQNAPHIRFYASANLKSYDGFNVGTMCVYDTKPGDLSEQQRECLTALASQVSHIMELDRSLKQLQEQNTLLREIARIESHELRQPVASIMGITALMRENPQVQNPDYLNLLELSVMQLDERIRTIVDHSNSGS